MFVFKTFVEGAEVRDLSDLANFFGNNEAGQIPLGGIAFSKNCNINHVLEFLFTCLFKSMRDQVHLVVYWFQTR